VKLFDIFRKKTILKRSVPVHIAIFMDGNGRWAKKRGLPRKAGHSIGAKTFRSIASYCNKIGVKYLTVYAFSTENWSRPIDEVEAIMNLLRTNLKEALSKFKNENIKTKFIGDISKLNGDIKKLIKEAEEGSKNATGLTLNIALNYGGRAEIVRAAKLIAEDVKNGIIAVNNINEKEFAKRIYTAGQPDPDLIIRSSGELRISNFLLWQSAYSEFWFSNILWPDFTTNDLEKAINDYNMRNRRFGGI
jgi:undecaprenyl diphosphate synthase